MNAVQGKKDNFYTSPEWRKLRKMKLDEYDIGFGIAVCQRCLVKFGELNADNLEAHHIMPRSKYPELELDPDNIVILCKPCNLQLGNSGTVDWDRNKEVKEKMEYIL